MRMSFTHHLHQFDRWEERGYWCSRAAIPYSDCHREMATLLEEGLPKETMRIVSFDWESRKGHRYYHLTIDFSADEQVLALAERLHEEWREKKRAEDEHYQRQYREALANQQAQGIDTMDFEV